MKAIPNKVLLLHNRPVMHYRIPIYNYFYDKFEADNIRFLVAAPGVEDCTNIRPTFPLHEMKLTYWRVMQLIKRERPHAVIVFSGISNLALFPIVWSLRAFDVPVIYWGHGINLSNKQAHRALYHLLHGSCQAIILYGEHLRQYIDKRYWRKVFIANNTLCLGQLPLPLSRGARSAILANHNIQTEKNIIFTGRIQVRKRIPDLLNAVNNIGDDKLGVILVGSDIEKVLPEQLPPRIIHIPGLYGDELLKLMMACDIYCCPGCVGLNIVDAMACGLPFVTEDVDHGPEIMYLKNGENGIVIPKGNFDCLVDVLTKILDDDMMRQRMSNNARETFLRDASIEQMYQGFIAAVRHVLPSGA